jgi:hypothetical protein
LDGEALEPPILLLDERKEYLIGREAGADIVLSAREVSRRHARIAWSAAANSFEIIDLSSRAGVLVNGKQVAGHVLADDDEVGIGPYGLRFRVYEGDISPLIDAGTPFPPGYLIAGVARRSDLLELLSLVILADVEMRIDIQGDAVSGSIAIAGGEVLAAEASQGRSGARAVRSLLSAERSRFELRVVEPSGRGAAPTVPLATLLSETLTSMRSDFETSFAQGPQHEPQLETLERRLAAAAQERQRRARTSELQGAVSKAEELRRTMQRPLPESPRVAFARTVRSRIDPGTVVHAVTQLGPARFRIFVAEPTGVSGLEGLMPSLLLLSEYERIDAPSVSGAAGLDLLHRRFAQRGTMRFTGAWLDLSLDGLDGPRASYVSDGALAIIHIRDGALTVPASGKTIARPGAAATLTSFDLAPMPGDRLLMLSSAFARQRDAGEHPIPLQAIASSATRHAALSLDASLDALLASLEALRSGAAQTGDLTVIGVDIRPGPDRL